MRKIYIYTSGGANDPFCEVGHSESPSLSGDGCYVYASLESDGIDRIYDALLDYLKWRKGPDGVSLVDGCGMSPSVMCDALFAAARRTLVPFLLVRSVGEDVREEVRVSFARTTSS